MKIALLICAVANYFSFFWSTIRVFRGHPDFKALPFRLLQLNTIALWIAGPFLIWNSQVHQGFPIIIMIQLLCLISFWKTSGIARENQFTAVYSKDTPVRLVRSGPYRYVRHPFYVIYMTCYISIAFVEFSLPYSLLTLSIISLYVHAAHTEEKKFEASGLSDEHKLYRSQTGMFFPKL
jgi:protein-S-isoprenylcysteine O-methyltransferase Ste14